MKTKIPIMRHSFLGAVCAGAVLLLVAGASAQNLFVGNNTFALGMASGSVIEITPGGGQSQFGPGGYVNPIGLAYNSAGDLFVADYGNGIYEINHSGQQSTFYSGAIGGNCLAFNSAGNLFVADSDNGTIDEFNPSGQELTPFASGLVYPWGLAFNSAGDLFESDRTTGDIYEYTPSGAQSIFTTGLNDPHGLAFDSAGDLFEAGGIGQINEFVNNHGTLISTPIVFATTSGYPQCLAFNSAGDLFETDYVNGNVYEYSPSGQVIASESLPNNSIGLALQPVPEPSDLALAGFGGLTLLLFRRQRK